MTKTGLKKAEFIPSNEAEKIQKSDAPDFVPGDEVSDDKPVSLIGFLYIGFLEIFGFRI